MKDVSEDPTTQLNEDEIRKELIDYCRRNDVRIPIQLLLRSASSERPVTGVVATSMDLDSRRK